MNKKIKFKDKKISFKAIGEGTPIIFLHGYLESLKIWDSFLAGFDCGYLLISIDLTGHGRSDTFGDVHTMDFMAEAVLAVINHLNINKVFIIGHSMGGYVTLAFADLFPARLLGISLFHSHPFADSQEIIDKRKKEIAFVKVGKKNLIAKLNVPNAFADDNLKKFPDGIKKSVEIAINTSEE